MTGIDLIIFDCDGVLVDSEIIASEVEAALLTEAGYPISVEEMAERFAGMTWHNTLLQIEKEASIPLSASLIDKVDTILDKRLERDVKIIDGLGPNGAAWTALASAKKLVKTQTGYVYHYAFFMFLGIAGLLTWVVFGMAH